MTAETTTVAAHLDPGEPKSAASAANILARHNNNEAEANITSAVVTAVDSDTLYQSLAPLMPKGQFGARHVQKQLWKPRFSSSIRASLYTPPSLRT